MKRILRILSLLSALVLSLTGCTAPEEAIEEAKIDLLTPVLNEDQEAMAETFGYDLTAGFHYTLPPATEYKRPQIRIWIDEYQHGKKVTTHELIGSQLANFTQDPSVATGSFRLFISSENTSEEDNSRTLIAEVTNKQEMGEGKGTATRPILYPENYGVHSTMEVELKEQLPLGKETAFQYDVFTEGNISYSNSPLDEETRRELIDGHDMVWIYMFEIEDAE